MPTPGAAIVESARAARSTADHDDIPLVFYPAYCYKASPTWFTWVKLTAYRIHYQLQSRHEFPAVPTLVKAGDGWKQRPALLLFYLNHPIQFVQLVGVVVAFEDHFDKFWLFTLDDSSGATLEVNCPKPWNRESTQGRNGIQQEAGTEDNDMLARSRIMQHVRIGSVVQVKGRLGLFRDARQLQLERIALIHETNREMQLIAARIDFQQKVLATPWQLSTKLQKCLHEDALKENEAQKLRAHKEQKSRQLRSEREDRHTKTIIRHYDRDERLRRAAAEEARRAGRLS